MCCIEGESLIMLSLFQRSPSSLPGFVALPHTYLTTHRHPPLSSSQAVTALSIDLSGARLATGSHDYDLKLWDFGGMDSRMKPFKSVEPWEGHPVGSAEWSPDGQAILVTGGGMQAMVYGRDGEDG